MKVRTILYWLSLLFFSNFSIAESNTAEKINSMNMEKTPEWIINKMNEWTNNIHSPMLIKSTFTTSGVNGTADFYFLGNTFNTTWLTLLNFEKPVKYGFVVFKNKDSREEAYFPSLKQRVYRYDVSRNPSKVEKFMRNMPTEPWNYNEILNFSDSLSVKKTETGDYLLSINVKENEAMAALGTKSLIFNILVTPEGKSLQSGIIANNATTVIINTYTYPNVKVDPQEIISKYVVPALNVPLMPKKSFNDADTQAVNIAQQER